MTALFRCKHSGKLGIILSLAVLGLFAAGCEGVALITDRLNPPTATIPVNTQNPTEAAGTAMAAITPKATLVINTPLPPTALPSPTLSPDELAEEISISDIRIAYLPVGAGENSTYLVCEEGWEGFITCSLPRGGFQRIRTSFSAAGSGSVSDADLQRAMKQARVAIFIYNPDAESGAGKSLGRMTIQPGENGLWFSNLVLSTTNNAYVLQFVLGENVLASEKMYISQPSYYPTPQLPGAN